MKQIVIVNADDANLTAGVTDAILECHDEGIVTSTTWMVNFPSDLASVREVKKRKSLGVGLHLNITRGYPVSPLNEVASLTVAEGEFRVFSPEAGNFPKGNEVALEYRNQIEKFEILFGRMPTHLDTHHQLHDHPFFFHILTAIAHEYRLPIRRSKLMMQSRFFGPGLKSTQYLFGNLNPSGHWQADSLETILGHLPEGLSEIICHPGKNDASLSAVSSFREGREAEYRLFRSPKLRKMLVDRSVTLGHYGTCFGT
jgi:predicted glycoside hydrolase/deacetylase ChbG (UPF0249 family)